jgi:RNA polymerase sigma-70 factor, ECF subfamily
VDASLFQRLVDTWYDPLYRFALSLARNGDEALDLTQQTFARWAQKGHGLKDTTKAKSWLFTVLYREFINTRRHQHRESTSLDENRFEELPAEEKPLDSAIDGQSALAALQQIDPAFRAPLVLFYLENHSYREIAAILDVPIGTVMSRISRGKEQLRARLNATSRQPTAQVIPLRQVKGNAQ